MKNLHLSENDHFPYRTRGRNRFRKFAIVTVISVLVVAICVGAFLVFRKSKTEEIIEKATDGENTVPATCTNVPDIQKLDCYPDAPVTPEECSNRGCCYNVPKNSFPPLNIPYCFYPSTYNGYSIESVNKTSRRIFAKLKRGQASGFRNDVANLNLLVSYLDDNTLRVKITDADSQRFEVPIPLYYQTRKLKSPLYNVTLDQKTGKLSVKRSGSGAVIFQTDLSLLVYSDQFLQLSSNLPSKYVYGLGEHYGGILRSVNWTRFTMLNSDLSPKANHALYGSHPFYMAMEKDGKANGVFLVNSNIMDVILQPTPAITFRPIGGILDFFIMLGPSPKDVTRQYSSIVGKTFMPPYWSFGFQLCRYGYDSLNTTRDTMESNIKVGVPLDVQWNDIDYMDRFKDFTYDKEKFAGLPEFVDSLHARGMHYVMIIDPGLSNVEKVYPPYDEGLDDDVFVKNENGSLLVGKVWTDGTLVFPDFSHPAATPFWTRQFQRYYDEVKFDGVWIDMNEPSNFFNGAIDGCPNSPLETPQYIPGGNDLKTKTLCMTAKHYSSSHYNEHNLYAYREAVATNKALRSIRKKRPFIISRASFAGQGVYGGHWSGDIFSTWEDMRYSIPSMINFNFYAIPMVGSDICGFVGNTTGDLCARWQTLGAFYPFSRNHNTLGAIPQDPASLGPVVTQAATVALQKRYTLIPYLYTLFYRSHAFGDTVIRPLFLEFPEDETTYSIDEQFLWGSGLMVAPVLYPNTTIVKAYFPKGLWYDAVTATQMNSSGEYVSIDVSVLNIYLSFRGGVIFPAQTPAQTTEASRRNLFNVAVALDEENKAEGELYWDDGDSLETYENGFYNLIKFDAKDGKLTSSIINNGYTMEMRLGGVTIAGLKELPSNVTFNGIICTPMDSLNVTGSEDIGIFGINVTRHLTLENNSDCQFGRIADIYLIQTKPVSLLSPLTVTWE